MYSQITLFLFFISFSSLYGQKVEITKIIDTNLFEINKQDTVKLANLQIPSKMDSDSLLKANVIPYVLQYEYKRLLRKYFIMRYADKTDSLSRYRLVYLYVKHPFTKDFINEEILLKGYGKFIPLKDSEAQIKCEKAALKARKSKKGIWNPPKYFHSDLGMKELSFQFGYGHGNFDGEKNYSRYMLSYRNEQNRFFSAILQIAYFRYDYMEYPEAVPEDDDYIYTVKKVNNNLLLVNTEINANGKYIGLKFLLRLNIVRKKDEDFQYFPFMPGIGVNLGDIKNIYMSLEVFPFSQSNYYLMALSAHYFLALPFWEMHFYYYFNADYNNAKEFQLRLSFSVNHKISFKLGAASIIPDQYVSSKNYFALNLGVGYLFH